MVLRAEAPTDAKDNMPIFCFVNPTQSFATGKPNAVPNSIFRAQRGSLTAPPLRARKAPGKRVGERHPG